MSYAAELHRQHLERQQRFNNPPPILPADSNTRQVPTVSWDPHAAALMERARRMRELQDKIDTNLRIATIEKRRPHCLSDAFGSLSDEDAPSPVPSYQLILRLVCERYGITRQDMISHRRPVDVCHARHVFFYLCRQLTPMSYPRMSRVMGDRDHTTAYHSWQVIGRLVERDEQQRADIEQLASKIMAHAFEGGTR